MAIRSWTRLLLLALAVGVLAGAGQLGLAYGLGIVRFARAFDPAIANHWYAQLAWVTWFPMVAATAGGLVANRLARQQRQPVELGPAMAIAGAAALGALTVAPLAMQPARVAEVAAVDPVLAAGWSAALGALIGFLAALGAVRDGLVARNILMIIGSVWLLALISVAPSLGPTDPLPAVRLGVLDPTWLSAASAQRVAVLVMPALALIAGAATGALGRLEQRPMLTVATSGIAGPAMLALAYLAAGPGGDPDKYQAAPYWGALISVGAGALGSLLAALIRRPTAPAGQTQVLDPADRTADDQLTATAPTGDDQRTATAPTGDDQRTTTVPTGTDQWSAQAPTPASTATSVPTSTAASAPTPTFGPGPDTAAPTGSAEPAEPVSQVERVSQVPPTGAGWDRLTTPHGSTEPDEAAEPARAIERTRTAVPARTAEPARTVEPARIGEPDTDGADPEAPQQRRSRRGRGKRDVSARDEEYVDWVAGLSGPAPKHEAPPRDTAIPRRSLRTRETGPDDGR